MLWEVEVDKSEALNVTLASDEPEHVQWAVPQLGPVLHGVEAGAKTQGALAARGRRPTSLAEVAMQRRRRPFGLP